MACSFLRFPLETRPFEFFIDDLRSADMHALYENGFGSDFVDTVYTAVFGGDTESTKIVQADIVTASTNAPVPNGGKTNRAIFLQTSALCLLCRG